MPDRCPPPSILAAWSSGRPTQDWSASDLEQHLAVCLNCAQALDDQTLSCLKPLHLEQLGSRVSTAPATTNPWILRMIASAIADPSNPAVDGLPRFLAELMPSSHPGSLGRFAGYEVEAVIGRGGMGVVFRAFDPTLQRPVALKVLVAAGQSTGDDLAASRFLREARAIATLRHPHVVEIYSAGLESGWPFLVMPFHVQGTLQQWIDQGRPITPRDAAHLGIQLLRALEFTHSQGILHRDLKPSNVLLEQSLNHVRLADFGLAQAVHDSSPSLLRPSIAGTPAFMAPEQARGERLDARTDLFGLGALWHALLTGHPPPTYLPNQSPTSHPTEPPAIPSAFQPVLRRLLAPSAADRYPNAAAARLALEETLARMDQPKVPSLLRHPVKSFLAILAIALAILGGLEGSGRTSWVNALLCTITGDGFFVLGQWGSYDQLAAAATACRPGETVIARFHGQRPANPVRVGPQGLQVRAATGFRPTLVSTNTNEALILALGPLVLEGLTLINRADSQESGQLITAEGVPVRLVHCRLLRQQAAGDDLVIRMGKRLDPDQPQLIHKPLIALRSGSRAELQGCLVVGLAATVFGLRGNGPDPIHIEIHQSLVVSHRTLVLRPESQTRVTVLGRNSAFAFASLVDIENAFALEQLSVTWDQCLLDRTGGLLLRWSRGGNGSWLDRLTWTENQVVHAGSGPFAGDRRRATIISAAEWNALVRLPEGTHHRSSLPLFGATPARSSLQVDPADVDVSGLAAETGLPPAFRPEEVGDGSAYDRYRTASRYRMVPATVAPMPGPRSR